MAISESLVAQLAVEYWRLLQTVERAVAVASDEAKERLKSQASYAIVRFETLLHEQQISIQEFDGCDFAANLPVSPVNGDECESGGQYVVERTIEPTIVCDTRVLITGKVLLARKS
jgi:hypothetical protein